MFFLYVITGKVSPAHEYHEGRQLYNIHTQDDKIIEYAYREEVEEWIATGSFEYNEDY
jgi:hypothetical protein